MEDTSHINPPSRRMMLTGLGSSLGASLWVRPALAETPPALPFGLKGVFRQSGFAIGLTEPGAEILVDEVQMGKAAASGAFYVGFDRDSPATCQIETRGRTRLSHSLTIATASYDVQSVNGLPPQTVTPTDPNVLKQIAADTALKTHAFLSRVDADWFLGEFRYPLDKFTVSGHFGNQRILNGVPKSPHMGFDMAAPIGTPIHAPQKGTVILAEPDMFFEGGLILIDHGQGLISMYLHQSKLRVCAGQIVAQGQIIGEVGMKGRATGPHLCWRLKWRDRHMDPSLMVA